MYCASGKERIAASAEQSRAGQGRAPSRALRKHAHSTTRTQFLQRSREGTLRCGGAVWRSRAPLGESGVTMSWQFSRSSVTVQQEDQCELERASSADQDEMARTGRRQAARSAIWINWLTSSIRRQRRIGSAAGCPEAGVQRRAGTVISLSGGVARLARDDAALGRGRDRLAVVLELERRLVEVEGPDLPGRNDPEAGFLRVSEVRAESVQRISGRTSSRWR